jgi:hypothetical protein
LHIVPRIRYLGFATRGKKGPFTTTRDLSACKSKRTLIQLLTVNSHSSSTNSPLPRVRVPWHVARLVAQARRRLLHLRRTFGCFGTSRGLSRESSSNTSPRAGSSSTTSPTPCVRVPRHVVRLAIDYFAPRRLVVDYFNYAVHPGASARRAAHRRLLRLHRTSGSLGTSRGSARSLVVDYFTYAVRPVASARHAACRMTHRRLLRLAQARRRLLRLRHTSGCLGTSRGSSRGSSRRSSSTTSPPPRVRVPQHVAQLVEQARRRLLHLRRASGCFSTSRGLSRDSSSTTSPTPRVRVTRHVARLVARLVVDYFTSAARPGASARRAARHQLL